MSEYSRVPYLVPYLVFERFHHTYHCKLTSCMYICLLLSSLYLPFLYGEICVRILDLGIKLDSAQQSSNTTRTITF